VRRHRDLVRRILLALATGLLAAGCGTTRPARAPATPAVPPLPEPSPPEAEPAPTLGFPVPGATQCSRGFSPGERHFALDIPAAPGTPVLAAGPGVVVRADRHRTYGLMALLRHPGFPRAIYTLYAHLSVLEVAAEDVVDAGAKIGEVGQTGNARGPHLHWEILSAPAAIPFLREGPLGVPGDAHRVDPAALAANIPPGCASL
jgi:murein DD-endopeptidase MepM/ murein hydrolase activator NlpD